METTLSTLKSDFKEFKFAAETKMDDRFRGADARQLELRLNQRIDHLDQEVDRCCSGGLRWIRGQED